MKKKISGKEKKQIKQQEHVPKTAWKTRVMHQLENVQDVQQLVKTECC